MSDEQHFTDGGAKPEDFEPYQAVDIKITRRKFNARPGPLGYKVLTFANRSMIIYRKGLAPGLWHRFLRWVSFYLAAYECGASIVGLDGVLRHPRVYGWRDAAARWGWLGRRIWAWLCRKEAPPDPFYLPPPKPKMNIMVLGNEKP